MTRHSSEPVITREEVVAEAEDASEVEWYDAAVAKTGPFTRHQWEHSRWDWRCVVKLLRHERALFFQIDRAHRRARGN